MTATAEGFLLRFPEFKTTRSNVAALLAVAETQAASTLGGVRDEAIYLMVADRIANSPDGRRVDAKGRVIVETTYSTQLAEIASTHALGRRVAV